MKKGILLIVVLLVILSSVVNAGLFSGVWQDYFTGRQVKESCSSEGKAELCAPDLNGCAMSKTCKSGYWTDCAKMDSGCVKASPCLDGTPPGRCSKQSIPKLCFDGTLAYNVACITTPVEVVPVKEVSPESISPEDFVNHTEPIVIITTPNCNGCSVNNICAPFGLRKEGTYCDISKQFLQQKDLKESCENNYECRSNECSNNECISTAGLLQKLLDFFSLVFGR